MNKQTLEMDLNSALQKFSTRLETIYSRGYDEDLQNVINEFGQLTLDALGDFKKAILDNVD